MEFGVAGYLPKPFALETLLEVCERFLSHPSPTPDDRAGADAAPEPTLEDGG